MGKNVPFTTNLATLMMFIPIGALTVAIWSGFFLFIGSWSFKQSFYIELIFVYLICDCYL